MKSFTTTQKKNCKVKTKTKTFSRGKRNSNQHNSGAYK